MAGLYSQPREAVRVKVKKCEANHSSEWRKFSVDPQITSLDVLYSIVAKAFDIKSDFSIKYKAFDPAGNEIYLNVLSDWDLDAAFLRIHNLSIQTATEPCLILQIDVKPFTEMREYEPETSPSSFGAGARDIIQPIQQSIGMSQKYVQNMQTKLPGLIMNQMEKTFSIVQKALNLNEEPVSQVPPRPPLSDNEFRMFLDPVGQILRTDELRKVIFLGGIDPGLRRVVWKHILNVYPKDMNGRERMDYMKIKSDYYLKLRDTWKNAVKRGCLDSELSYVTSMVKKDVLRTDRLHPFYAGSDDNQNIASLFNILTTYALNHPSVSYCQGMSDIASPLLVTMNDEAQAYICFCAVMARLKGNFMLDGVAMTMKFSHLTEALNFYDPEFYEYLKTQQADDLLFCYRWLLLELKREFPFEDSMRMLEVQWSSLKYDSNDSELALVEKEFEPIFPEEQPPVSPSYLMAKPRENHYTKICALRKQSSSVSLSSTCSSQNLSSSFTNSPGHLAAMRRLNQSMDDNLSRGIRRIRNISKAHQSLDESKIIKLMGHINENKMLPSEIDAELDEDVFHEAEDECPTAAEVTATDDSDNRLDFVFHPTNPFMEDAAKHNSDVNPVNTTGSSSTNIFLEMDDLSEDGSEEKPSLPKYILKLQNKNIFSNYSAVSNIITKQIQTSTARKGGHFKELKERIVANKLSRPFINETLKATPTNENETEKPIKGQKLIKNFNELLNISSINRLRGSEKQTVENCTSNSLPSHPLLKLMRDIYSPEESDSSTPDTNSESVTHNRQVSIAPTMSSLHLHQDLKKDVRFNQNRSILTHNRSITSNDSQDFEYYPMATAMSREFRIEMDSIDRQIFGSITIPLGPSVPNSSEIEYEDLDRDSMELMEEIKDDEVIVCTDANELIVRRRDKNGKHFETTQRISTCSSSKSDVFIWENPLHQISSNSNYNFSDIVGSNPSSPQPQYEEDIFQYSPSTTTELNTRIVPSLDNLNPFIEANPFNIATVPSTSVSAPEFLETHAALAVEEATTADITYSTKSPTAAHNDALPPPNELGGGNPFLMFLCLTLLLQHRNPIIKGHLDYNEIAMHFDKMVRKHDVNRVLNQARRMYIEYLKTQNTADSNSSTTGKNNNS